MNMYTCAILFIGLCVQSIFADQELPIDCVHQLHDQINAMYNLEQELVQVISQEHAVQQKKQSRLKKRNVLTLLALLGITISISFGWSLYQAWCDHERDMQQIREQKAQAYAVACADAQACACATTTALQEHVALAAKQADVCTQNLRHTVAQMEAQLQDQVACNIAQSRRALDVIQAAYQSTNQHVEQVIIPGMQAQVAKFDTQVQSLNLQCEEHIRVAHAQKNALCARADGQDLIVRLACARNSESVDAARQEHEQAVVAITQAARLLEKKSENIDGLYTTYRNRMADHMQRLQPAWYRGADWLNKNEHIYNVAGSVQKVSGFFASFVPLFRVVDQLMGDDQMNGAQDDYQSRDDEYDLAARLANLHRQSSGGQRTSQGYATQ